MKFDAGDVVVTKKAHPCGSDKWQILRVGMDFKMKCVGCGHEVMVSRAKAEKSIKKIESSGGERI